MIRAIFDKYILLVSILMVVQVALFAIPLAFDWDTYAWIKNALGSWNGILNHALWYLFIFSFVNILIVGISGIVFLTERKTLRLGIFSLIATGLYLWCAIQSAREL